MALPIKSILWAPTNTAHNNHLHVEGDPRFTGTPPLSNPGMSDSVWTIYVALTQRFGEPAYFTDVKATTDWTHMGWYNRRRIAGSVSWSQHAWSNALDIGPYYGVAQQQKFYDFLTGKDPTPPKGFDMLQPCKKGDIGEHVKALQIMLNGAGFPPGAFDGIYGNGTASALLAARRSVGSSVSDGNQFDTWAYQQLHQAHVAKFAIPGPRGPRGSRGATGEPGPSGPPGAPGPQPRSATFSY